MAFDQANTRNLHNGNIVIVRFHRNPEVAATAANPLFRLLSL
ncbi:MAG: hypothetical protein ABGZ53_10530 [Fuerstiella sp.]